MSCFVLKSDGIQKSAKIGIYVDLDLYKTSSNQIQFKKSKPKINGNWTNNENRILGDFAKNYNVQGWLEELELI